MIIKLLLLSCGFLMGWMTCAVFLAGKNADDISEAYKEGLERGKTLSAAKLRGIKT